VRTLALFVFLALAGLIYLAVVLRLPSARAILSTILRIGWLWAALVVILGAIEAYRRWA
jgi:hypothetical protein